jgi:hypothetical protein
MTDDTHADESTEARILQAMKDVLVDVIRDTTTQPGMKHPLSEKTIDNIRHCLTLITSRQSELAEAAGKPMTARPRYVDEPQTSVVVSLDSTKKSGEDGEDND